MTETTYSVMTWALALLLSFSVESHAKGWGQKFVEKVADTGAELDPTNPNGAVRTGAESAAKGVRDPLRVVRHAGDVLKEIGVDVAGAAQDPIKAANDGLKVFKKEAEVLGSSLVVLRQQAQSLPKLKTPAVISQNLGKIKGLPTVSIASVNLGPSFAMITSGIMGLGEAGKAIERFIMLDIPREAKRFGGDINREARKGGDQIASDWHNCWNGSGCNIPDPFGGGPNGCDDQTGPQLEKECWEKELRRLRVERDRITGRINGALNGAKARITNRKAEIEREFVQLDAEIK